MSILSSSPTGIFRRKPVDEVEPEDLQEGGGLQRVLGLWQLTAIGIGGIIGAGIFSLAGAVANEKAGPGVLLSFLVAGVASACAALSYAEFAGMIPKAGSAYTYGYVVLGEGALLPCRRCWRSPSQATSPSVRTGRSHRWPRESCSPPDWKPSPAWTTPHGTPSTAPTRLRCSRDSAVRLRPRPVRASAPPDMLRVEW